MNKILVAYYSFSGTTQGLATEIAKLVGGELRPLVPLKLYSFDYNTAAKKARNEIANGYSPLLQTGNDPIDDYDTIFIGSPNWFKTMAPPVLSFLRAHDFSEKTIVPFCSHGGGGFGQVEENIKLESAAAKVLPGYAAHNGGTPEQVREWLTSLELI